MKVIGKTPAGYLVEATHEELAAAAGYHTYDSDWREKVGRTPDLLGLQISVTSSFRFVTELHRREEQAKELAATLTAVAKLITHNLPTSVIVPEEPAEPDEAQS